MKALLLFLVSVTAWADSPVTITLRGHAQTLVHLQAPSGATRATVIFLPGDGGWRGAAVTMARTISSFGYDVYGFDTKDYLEAFSQNGAKLSQSQLAADMRTFALRASGGSAKPTILVGWSQGAGMAVAAAANSPVGDPIAGVITLGLPESAVLGWDWKATLAIITRREPDQPTFPVRPLLAGIAPTPVWMIHGSADEYTSMESARALFQSASEPKRFDELTGADHHFSGHETELYQSLKAGLQWIAGK